MTELPDRRMVDCLVYVKGLIMKDIISSIITSVLTALYQPFWFSVILSVMVLFFYLFAYHNETGGKGNQGSFFRVVAVFQRKCFFSEAVFSDLLYNHDLVSYAAEPGYVDESPFGCDGELVDLEIWRGWYQISHNRVY